MSRKLNLRRRQNRLPPSNATDFTVSNETSRVYWSLMGIEPRNFRSIIVLALLLVLGPLQAQALYSCEMMGVTLEECCCDDLEGAANDAVAHIQADPCCERIVEVRADPDAPEVVKPVEVRSDVDPPTSIVASSIVVFPSIITRHLTVQWNDDRVRASGRNTYLTTQRLRI